jgi:hypothetical protein
MMRARMFAPLHPTIVDVPFPRYFLTGPQLLTLIAPLPRRRDIFRSTVSPFA